MSSQHFSSAIGYHFLLVGGSEKPGGHDFQWVLMGGHDFLDMSIGGVMIFFGMEGCISIKTQKFFALRAMFLYKSHLF